MLYLSVALIFILLNIVCDVNYFIKSLLIVIRGRMFQYKRNLLDVTTIYGIGTYQDCGVKLKYVRLARLVRELDMARYHFYELTGIYQRSQHLNIKSLQGCTLTMTMEPVPIFAPYKINTKLIYWDDRSLFLEHEVITIRDGKRRSFLLSRQHALGKNGDCTEALLKGLPGSEARPTCPEYIKKWLESMEISSYKLRHFCKNAVNSNALMSFAPENRVN